MTDKKHEAHKGEHEKPREDIELPDDGDLGDDLGLGDDNGAQPQSGPTKGPPHPPHK